MTSRRVLEVLMGAALVAYALYSFRAGHIVGRRGRLYRADQPGAYWFALIVSLLVGLVCLGGVEGWRE